MPSLKDIQGRERKEGGRREREERRGDFCSQENKTVKVGVKKTQKEAGEEAEIYRPVSCFLRCEI